MTDIFPVDQNVALSGVAKATDGPETDLGGLFAADFDVQAIDANYLWMRQRRVSDYKNEQLDALSSALYGKPDAWRSAPDPADSKPSFGMSMTIREQMMKADGLDYDADSGRRVSDAAVQKMFDDLASARETSPGEFANFADSLDDLTNRAGLSVAETLSAERADAEFRSGNRSVKTVAGGIAGFAGAAGAAVTDVEGLATLPFGGFAGSFGRVLLAEAALGAASEAITLPAYNAQADFLNRDRPDPVQQILFGAAFGSALPLAGRSVKIGANTLTKNGRVQNRDLLGLGTNNSDNPSLRGATDSVARDVASEDVAPTGVSLATHTDQLDAAETAIMSNEPVIVRGSDAVPALDKTEAPGLTRQLLDFIGDIEAPEGYDQVWGKIQSADQPPRPLTQMSINEVLAWQDSIDPKYNSEAAGRYQIMEDTLRGLKRNLKLSGNERFDSAMQDRLAIGLMQEKGLDQFLAGRISVEQFGNGLSGVWAALPKVSGPNAGRSTYAGDGQNKALTSTDKFMSVLTTPGSYRPLSDDARAGDVYNFNPANLRTDADSYQYKEGGDSNGVTDRLLTTREWDASAAVGIMVHERIDGGQYVADGHQRVGLANRLINEGATGIELQGHLYRESDGWTVTQVRAMAAKRNILQESGTPLDAAKIIRDHPELTASISRSRGFMSNAEGLAKLQPGPFRAMINNVIPQNYGGLVGRIIPDDVEMQSVAISALAKAEPANILQAESMIRDIRRMGLERKANDDQASLFGDGFDLGASAIGERARVLDAATKELRRDKTVFARLSAENQRIEEAGNVLDRSSNASREQTAQRALERLIILADEPGPVRDALDAAARALRAGGRISDAAQDVIEAITGRDRKDIDRAGTAGTGNDGDAAASTTVTDQGDALTDPDLFGDPIESAGATAQIDQIERDLRVFMATPKGADMLLPIGSNDEPSVRLTDIMADIDADAEFIEQLNLCMPKGLTNV